MPSVFSRSKDSENEVTHSGAPADSTRATPPGYADDAIPPTYKATSYLTSLREGDPNDKIDVPMIHSTHKLSFGDYLPWGSAMKTGKRTVISRSMTRDCYVKHYAKDEEGNYIGTERPYPDHQLVSVPNKSTPDDILKQASDDLP
ncbi:uncharacterized protein M421DRAFT_420242 [Didymella exigua CBS 183.55]|uniref:Uncharacterized protein n=1 Tax=Didymella exigua CBS 183.55 TaxID=1150837 RepID=A0A6A5RNM4_9PLEO|nr:uncharacterized protein M421DRAFT_420242 [Didymella exigua CBS 183.55]KAF1929013.1 hypothetical protein M421DRAFT_420242 [Didymella exigua CBS 183.55]